MFPAREMEPFNALQFLNAFFWILTTLQVYPLILTDDFTEMLFAAFLCPTIQTFAVFLLTLMTLYTTLLTVYDLPFVSFLAAGVGVFVGLLTGVAVGTVGVVGAFVTLSFGTSGLTTMIGVDVGVAVGGVVTDGVVLGGTVTGSSVFAPVPQMVMLLTKVSL